MAFQCYGENSFTFLLFQALRSNNRFRDLLLSNLKQFGTGKNFKVESANNKEPEIWLFPSFGRGTGFGEPDALVLFGSYSFWFEVETVVNLRSGRPDVKQSLLQMARFHFLHQALNLGATTRKYIAVPDLAITGPTVGNSDNARFAILRVRDHPVLQQIRSRLAESEPHYVLLAEARAQGIPDSKFPEELEKIRFECSADLSRVLKQWAEGIEYLQRAAKIGYLRKHLPQPPDKGQCWYAYWRHHLEPAFKKQNLNPIKEGGYVRIASA